MAKTEAPEGKRDMVTLDPNDKFEALLTEIATLQRNKASDYGTNEDPNANLRASEDFGISSELGCVLRMNDKVFRLKTYFKKGTLANESVEDSLKDIAVYALKALSFIREKKQ